MYSAVFLIALLFLIQAGLVVAVFLWLKHTLQTSTNSDTQRQVLKGLVNEVFGEVSNQVSEQGRQLLRGEQQKIEAVVAELRRELSERQRELKQSEENRHQQFAQIATSIQEHQQITKELSGTADHLRRLLNNSADRGHWGEFVLEDLLRTAGMTEGIQYVRQTTLGTTTVRPDVTLLLPNERTVAIDAKFPFAAAIQIVEAKTKAEKEAAEKALGVAMKQKIQDVLKRGYIAPEQGTLDYTIIFIPNEMLFAFINERLPDIVQFALQSRVLLVSPFTFLSVARTIMESHRNFHLENHLREIVGHLNEFTAEWEKIRDEFEKLGSQIETVEKTYHNLSGTRWRQMNKRVQSIGQLPMDQGLSELRPDV